ncbi:MAG: ABC transporter ATP-binding protein [Deltaproteobacteria bacterium]|nr:ABC transporter ATP-binding protein [Deltaproteobacteria bacterium]
MLSVRNISKSYPGGKPVLSGVTLQVKPRSFATIMGPSGSGKSTLLSIIAGIDTADSGDVSIGDFSYTGRSLEELAAFRLKHLGIVFQFFNLLPTLTVQQNVEIPGHLAGRSAADTRIAARECLQRTGVESLRERYPHELSGGELQRVAIARAMLNRPRLLLADEPTGNLDQKNGQSIIELFRSLVDDGATLVVVTHDERMSRAADSTFALLDGVLGTS